MREQAIVLNQLTKHYGTHRGINDLSFSVNEGEFFGFYLYLCHVLLRFTLVLNCNTKISEKSDMAKS